MTYLITAPFLDLAFRGFCIIAGVFAVGVLVEAYVCAFRVWRGQ